MYKPGVFAGTLPLYQHMYTHTGISTRIEKVIFLCLNDTGRNIIVQDTQPHMGFYPGRLLHIFSKFFYRRYGSNLPIRHARLQLTISQQTLIR